MRCHGRSLAPEGIDGCHYNVTTLCGFSIRQATLQDAGLIADHRTANFRAMGQIHSDELATQFKVASAASLEASIRLGDYRGWLAIDSHQTVIGGAGVHSTAELPRPSADGTRIASDRLLRVVNVFTEPAWRRRGVAQALLLRILEWARAQGADRLLVYASEQGRALYARSNFSATPEMSWSTGAGPRSTRGEWGGSA
jgi:GNAT superfamily N-acetyltransferase